MMASLSELEPRSIIIDTDPGVDDAVALLLALGSSHQLCVNGVTIVCGNSKDIKALGANAKLILRLVERDDIPVRLGHTSACSVGISNASAVRVHGEDGLGGCAERYGRVAADFDGFHEQLAHDFIYETCARAPGTVSLVCLGPLTNVALALSMHPELPQLVREIVIMGGSVGEPRGNRTPAAEANFAHDPEAAQAVLTAGFKNVVLVGLNVTHQTNLANLCAACADLNTTISRFVCDICQNYIEQYRQWKQPLAPAHDALCILYLLHPNVFTKQSVRVEVETCGVLTRGMSIADWNKRWEKPENCEVLMGVDAEALYASVVAAIQSLPSR